jgi:hypothetical protein
MTFPLAVPLLSLINVLLQVLLADAPGAQHGEADLHAEDESPAQHQVPRLLVGKVSIPRRVERRRDASEQRLLR